MSGQLSTIRLGIVTSVYDEADGGRIKVHIIPEDEGVENDVFAFPAMPKILHIKPKINEYVLVITAIINNGHSQRYYIGPIISQPNHMIYDPWYLASTTLNRGEIKAPEQAQHTIPTTNGAYPKEEDIAIEGRKNAGLQITENDARLKAGVKVVDPSNTYNVSFNTKNPAFVKVKYHDKEQISGDGDTYQSTTSIVGDKIIMIGADNKQGFKVTDKNELISDEEMKKIIDTAHLLPYGDVLIQFLKLLINAFLNHTHPYNGMPPCIDPITGTQLVKDYDLNQINSDTFRVS